LRVQFTIEQKEFVEAHRAALKRMPRSPKWMGWLLCTLYFLGLVFCIGAMHGRREENPDLYLFAWMMLVWAYALMVAVILTNRHLLGQQYKKRFDGLELSFDYDETTVSMGTSRGAESRMQWRAVQDWMETPLTIVLLQDAFWFYVLPKRVFAAEAFDDLRMTLRSKVRSG
jgi:hypothetical protein